MASAVPIDKEGEVIKMIPASQRPDGTWRKPRRVKDGYVPQEEVPLYESKGRQFASRKQDYPVGLTPEIIAAATKPKKQTQAGKEMTCVIPGLLLKVDKTKKKKKKKTETEEVTEFLDKITIRETSNPKPPMPNASTEPNTQSSQDPTKKLRGLKKKLRDIQTLVQKIKSGELKNPEKDQLDKIARQAEIESEIALIEAQV